MSAVQFVPQRKLCGGLTNAGTCRSGDLTGMNYDGKSLKCPIMQSKTLISVPSVVAKCLRRFSDMKVVLVSN